MRPGAFDVLLVQREAALLGPPLLESVLVGRGTPLILDIDDAIYLQRGGPRPAWSGLRTWPQKIERLVELASLVTCGSEAIRDHALRQGKRAVHVPNVLDSHRWAPARRRSEGKVTVGWIGTHSSFPYLRRILPSLEAVARTRPFRLLVVGSGERELAVPGVEVLLRRWSLEREVADFQQIDIGLYPIDDDAWGRGKSALKSVQYLMTGTPFIVSPVGEAAGLGLPGVTHLTASSHDEWETNLALLLDRPDMRGVMGDRGRSFATDNLNLDVAQEVLCSAITSVTGLNA
jgi:glycosyltransferase involved in cell wall biosynthesis